MIDVSSKTTVYGSVFSLVLKADRHENVIFITKDSKIRHQNGRRFGFRKRYAGSLIQRYAS